MSDERPPTLIPSRPPAGRAGELHGVSYVGPYLSSPWCWLAAHHVCRGKGCLCPCHQVPDSAGPPGAPHGEQSAGALPTVPPQ